jgi:hypothetical protein
VGRLAAYRRWREEMRPEFDETEVELVNHHHGYIGHADRILSLRHAGAMRRGVLDIKPPSTYPWHGLQLAAYAGVRSGLHYRWSLHLSDERDLAIEWLDTAFRKGFWNYPYVSTHSSIFRRLPLRQAPGLDEDRLGTVRALIPGPILALESLTACR